MGNTLSIFLFGLYAAFFTLFVILNVTYYFDIVPYVAATLMVDTNDPTALHTATYALLENNLSDSQFSNLIAGPYALDLYENAQNFYSQLDLYLSKPLYILCLRLLYIIGFDALDALLLASLIPALGILLILFIWLKEYISPFHALAVTVIFSFAARLTDLTQGLVHNNLSSLFIVAAMYVLVNKDRALFAALLFCVSVFVRTENVIFVTVIFAYMSWGEVSRSQGLKVSRLGFNLSNSFFIWLGGLVSAICIYLGINFLYGHGWWFLFYHSLVASQLNINNFDIPFSFRIYMDVLFNSARALYSNGVYVSTLLPLFVLVLSVSIPVSSWKTEIKQLVSPKLYISPIRLVLLTAPVLLTYLFLFPLVLAWDRFFTHFYALFVLAIASANSKQNRTP